MTAPCVFDGPINGAKFLAYVEQVLAPTLSAGETVMMDNLGSPTQNHMDHIHVATKGGGYPRGGEVYRL